MASELVAHALTTVARIKGRLGLDTTAHDALFERLISAVTDFIEHDCNRRLKETTYTNEVYSVYGDGQDMIALKNTPVSSVSGAQYRAGTVSSPSWTSFIADQFELAGDGKSGLVRIYGGVPRGVNSVRFSYTAGYKIDFTAPTDTTKHTLPFDLSDLAERLVIKLFKKRDAEGKTTEGFESSSVTWAAFVEQHDRDILDNYKRVPTFV